MGPLKLIKICWNLVNIGLGNYVLPDDAESLLEPMLDPFYQNGFILIPIWMKK